MVKMKKRFFLFLAVFMIFIPSIIYAYDNKYVHPDIAEQALFVWPKDVNTNPSAYQEILQYLGVDYDTTVGNCESAKTVNGGGIREGAREEDDYDPITYLCNDDYGIGYFHHFYNADKPEPYNGLYSGTFGTENHGALSYAKLYWQTAKDYYLNNDKGNAYWYLGRIAHLLQDASVPAHVHNDPHDPVSGSDSYENYMKTYFWLWDYSKANQLPSLPETWKLEDIFWNLAQRTQYFPSDNYDGNTTNADLSWFSGWPDTTGWRKWGITDDYIENSNLLLMGDKLMPLAIQYTAALYKLFWNEAHGTLTGTVKDQNTGVAIKGASIVLDGPISCIFTETLENGEFTFNDLEQGYYDLRITKDGYEEKWKNGLNVLAGDLYEAGTINLTPSVVVGLPPAPTLISPGLSSEPGAEINTTTPTFLWNSVADADSYGLYISKKNADGTYSLIFDSETETGFITGTEFSLPGGKLANGEQYRWNMRSHNSSGWGNNFSDRLYFKVNTSTHSISITSGPSGSPNPVVPGGTANLNVTAVDSSGHSLAYAWTASCPTLSSNGTLIGTATQSPQWLVPANNTGSQQDCTFEVTVSDGHGLSKQATYFQGVSPGGVTSLSISDGIRLLEPPPYLLNGNATVDAVIKNISDVVVVIDRFQAIGQFIDKDGFVYERIWPTEYFQTPLSLNPGDTYRYTKLLTENFPGIATTATVMMYVKFNGIPGQEPITNFESGAKAQLVFEVGHAITITNGPGGSPNPVSSGGLVTLGVNASDSYGHGLNYSWTASCPGLSSNGTFSSSTAQNPTWMSPTNNTGSQQSCTIQLTVNDGSGGLNQTGSYTQVVTSVVASAIQLPKTGQTKCYDSAGAEIACAGTGQDGDIQAGVTWPSPRFIVNADTTVTDKLTGLVWVSNGNIMPTRDPGWDADGTANDGGVTWQHALDYVAKLNAENFLGHADWRLPNVNELESLVNAGEPITPTWLNTQGFMNVQAGYYWLSTSYAGNLSNAWVGTIWGDGGGAGSKSYSNFPYVWPVRAGSSGNADSTYSANIWKTGQTISYATGDDGNLSKGVTWPSPRFTDNGDGSVMDNLTGLIWLKDANCMKTSYSSYDNDYTVGDGRVSWQHALNFIKGINNGTYSNCSGTQNNWRLPNRKELRSLIDYSQYNPALPSGHPFINVQTDDYYWSSTSTVNYKDNDWFVQMWSGAMNFIYKNYYSGLYVWPVRDGQDDTTPPLGSISLNVGSTYTNSTSVSLTLSASDPNEVPQMCISNTASCSSWEAYTTSKSWALPSGDGTKTVYAWFKDGAGNVNSTPYSGSIILDTTAPANGSLSAIGGNTEVTLNWSGFSDTTSGINSYKLVFSTGDTPSSCTSGTQIYSGTDTTYLHTGLNNGVTYNYRVCAVDNVGNTSTGATAYATPFCTPSSLQVTINSPSAGFTVGQGSATVVSADVEDNCNNNVTGAAVSATFSNGDSDVTFYDDGAHNDGTANDGTYANTWTPNNVGTVTITVSATKTNLTSGNAQVSGAVYEVTPFKLPDTGQTKCYDSFGTEISCAGTGQDGEYNINPLSFTANGNGTVTDNNTGLMWQQQDDGNTYNWYQASGTYHETYNPNSINVCGSLSLGDLTDWRLPTKKELVSIIDYSVPSPGPTINSTYFLNTKSSTYWSYTSNAANLLKAWYVYFSSGLVNYSDKDYSGVYVRCVRGGQLDYGNFQDNGNGTITDNSTELTWQKGEYGKTTWQSALDYCNELTLGDHSDWRLPNIKELESITDDGQYNPSIDTNLFQNAYASDYWSSTTGASSPAGTWLVYFVNGYVYGYGGKSGSYYVRCVRGQSVFTPSVASTTPVNNDTDIALNSAVTINWNENIDCTTVTISTVTISPSVGWTRTSCSGSSAVFTPSGQASLTPYTVTVGTGVRDLAGNAMTSNYQFTYTTVVGPVNGQCGTSHRGTFASAPTTDLCAYTLETPTVVPTLIGWEWICTGANGGSDASCSANRELSSFNDSFNNYSYTDNWDVNNTGTVNMTEGNTTLNVNITKPLSGCSYADLTSKGTFDGANLLVETGVRIEGNGEMRLRLKKDDNNFVQFGIREFGLDGLPDFIIGSLEDSTYTEQPLDLTAEYALRKKYKYKTFSIVKTGDEYRAYLNGKDTGGQVTNALVGDAGLKVELLNGVCSTELKGTNNYFDYVFVSETIDGSIPATDLKLLTPNGGEAIKIGSIYLVLWEGPAGAPYYSIDYSVNGGLNWVMLDSAVEGKFYTWKLQKVNPYTTYKLRVKAYDSLGTILEWDDSDSNFTIQY